MQLCEPVRLGHRERVTFVAGNGAANVAASDGTDIEIELNCLLSIRSRV